MKLVMKLVFILLLSAITGELYSQASQQNGIDLYKNYRISKYLIASKSTNINNESVTNYINDSRYYLRVPLIVNILVKFGIGSFIQGDNGGGFCGLLADLFSTGYISATAIIKKHRNLKMNIFDFLLPAFIETFSFIFQIVRPIIYYKYKLIKNSAIKKANFFITRKNNQGKQEFFCELSILMNF